MMNTDSDHGSSAPFLLGDWQVFPDSGRLVREGTEVRLEPRAMAVLVYLARHPGEVISRETLEAEIWAGTVVGYEAVSQSIIKLRKALNDDSRNPQYIETISKKGYRLIAPLSNKPNNDKPTQNLLARRNKSKFVTAGMLLVTLIGVLIFLVTNSEKPGSGSVKTPSLVVLPFKNLSDDPKQEYFSDGITDDLITDLSRLNSVRVIARQSSYHFRQHPAGLEDIANQLNVLYIVEGSVRKFGNRIRINVTLTDTDKGESIWAQRFDGETDDLFRLQDGITRNVMDALTIRLTHDGTIARGTSSFEAYDAFLIGQQHIHTRSRQGYELAMQAYRRALEIDPEYARAYGAMAVTLTRGYRYQWTDLSLVEARERALELAKQAVSLDQWSPQIYWSLGYVHLHRREYDAAETATRKAIALSPSYADGYALLANIANWRGKADEAQVNINKATELNPYHTFQYPSTLGLACYQLGQYDRAVNTLRDALDRNEGALNPRLFLAATYVRLNRLEDAAWEIKQLNVTRPEVTLSHLKTILPFENKKQLEALTSDLRLAGLT